MSYHNHVLINLSRTSSFSALIKPSGKFYFDQQPSQPRYHISQVKTQQPILSAFIMADRRPENQEMSRSKKQRTGELDPRANPYLRKIIVMAMAMGRADNTARAAHLRPPVSQNLRDIIRQLPRRILQKMDPITPSTMFHYRISTSIS
jgi:hypothetical protein